MNSSVVKPILAFFTPTLNAQVGDIKKIPLKFRNTNEISRKVGRLIEITKKEWHSVETSWDFKSSKMFFLKLDYLAESFEAYKKYWRNLFDELYALEKSINIEFMSIYKFEDNSDSNNISDIFSFLNLETYIERGQLKFKSNETFNQFKSYSVGCMMGRYSLDKDGLVLANQGETNKDFFNILGKSETEVKFIPDEDAIIPILDDKWFEDDIVGRFHEFLKVSFSPDTFEENLRFLEEQIGKDVRKWFVKDFYKDHIKRYKKRPIYWLFSSPKGHFSVLIYMHRYTPDMVSAILHDYLKPFVAKLEAHERNLDNQLMTAGLSASEKNKLEKKKKTTREAILDCLDYERDTLLDIAQRRIEIDLDDGVLVNYNKFGKAVKTVPGLNDAKAKKKVLGFDWIDTSLILD